MLLLDEFLTTCFYRTNGHQQPSTHSNEDTQSVAATVGSDLEHHEEVSVAVINPHNMLHSRLTNMKTKVSASEGDAMDVDVEDADMSQEIRYMGPPLEDEAADSTSNNGGQGS